MRYMNTIGQIVRNYLSASGGLVTFFAPYNEAFERIPEYIERRLLRDRIWLEQVNTTKCTICFILPKSPNDYVYDRLYG